MTDFPARDANGDPVTIIVNATASTFCASGADDHPLLTDDPQEVKAAAGVLLAYDFVNPNAVDIWVQVFDLRAEDVELGVTPPKLAKWVPRGGSNGDTLPGACGAAFGTAITIAATTTPTGSSPPLTGLVANVFYR